MAIKKKYGKILKNSTGTSSKKWIYKNSDQEKVSELCRRLNIPPLVATLLNHRNIQTVDEAKLFLDPNLSRLNNPFLLPDMEKAVVRVRQAINQNEKILVYGDRDVDGVTSTALLIRMFKNLGAQAEWIVPADEGYGLHNSVLERFRNKGLKAGIPFFFQLGKQTHRCKAIVQSTMRIGNFNIELPYQGC